MWKFQHVMSNVSGRLGVASSCSDGVGDFMSSESCNVRGDTLVDFHADVSVISLCMQRAARMSRGMGRG